MELQVLKKLMLRLRSVKDVFENLGKNYKQKYPLLGTVTET